MALALLAFATQNRRNSIWLEELSQKRDAHDSQPLTIQGNPGVRALIRRSVPFGLFDNLQLVHIPIPWNDIFFLINKL